MQLVCGYHKPTRRDFIPDERGFDVFTCSGRLDLFGERSSSRGL
jgi:hypothetical protein